MRTFSRSILLLLSAAFALVGAALLLGGPAITSAGAQSTRISVSALDTDEVELDERIEATYEMTVRGGDADDPAVSSSICGPFGDPDDGDDDDDGDLDEDETWTFECRNRFSGATDTITVLATDEDGATIRDFDSRDISYLDEEDDSEDDDEADPEDEEEEEDDSEEAADDDGSSSWFRRILFWAMAGALLGLVLFMLWLLLRRGRSPKSDKERLFL